jgi:hypothetical protein
VRISSSGSISRAQVGPANSQGAANHRIREKNLHDVVVSRPERRRARQDSSRFAGAILEILVHTNLNRLPSDFALIEIEIPDDVFVERIGVNHVSGWARQNRFHVGHSAASGFAKADPLCLPCPHW